MSANDIPDIAEKCLLWREANDIEGRRSLHHVVAAVKHEYMACAVRCLDAVTTYAETHDLTVDEAITLLVEIR